MYKRHCTKSGGSIEIETDKENETYTNDGFEKLNLDLLLDSWDNKRNIRTIDMILIVRSMDLKAKVV